MLSESDEKLQPNSRIASASSSVKLPFEIFRKKLDISLYL